MRLSLARDDFTFYLAVNGLLEDSADPSLIPVASGAMLSAKCARLHFQQHDVHIATDVREHLNYLPYL